MQVNLETAEQTNVRLRGVLAAATLVWHSGTYAFRDYPVSAFPTNAISQCLAFVRDDEVWSALLPAEQGDKEPVALFSFHFPAEVDNSGFVGWLASNLKRELGTGALVVCGYNSKRGGIFDYWGVPVSTRRAVARLLEELTR